MAAPYNSLNSTLPRFWEFRDVEFVNQLSQNPSNVVFALVRKLETAQKVLAISRPNIHVLQADISNVNELKVSVPFPIKHSEFDVLLRT